MDAAGEPASRRPIHDAGAIPLLVKALDRKDEVLREYAIESLGALRATTAALKLAELLRKDPARGVRICAARALADLAVPDAREALTAAARDDDEDSLVRTLCEKALTKLPR
jgi:HEAT repeat protein